MDHFFFRGGGSWGISKRKFLHNKRAEKILGKESHGERELKEVNYTNQALCLTIIREFKKTMPAMATET